MPATIPRRVREMTPVWLNEVYADVGIRATVSAIEVEQINIGTGFAGRVLRLRPTYEGSSGGAPASLIVKTPSPDPNMRAVLDEIRGYELESLFYSKLAEATPTPVPACVWNGADVEDGNYVLLLEDLEGYASGGQTADEIDLTLMRQVVLELARLHSAWWQAPDLASDTRVPTSDGPERLVWQRNALEGLPEWSRIFGSRFDERTVEGIGSGIERYAELSRAASDGAETLVHGDYRLDNMLYADDPDRPLVVIDWQLLHRGSGAYDLAYLIGQSVPTATRRAHEDEWLGLYLDELARSGYDEQRLRRDFAIGLLQSMVVPMSAAGLNTAIADRIAALPEGPILEGYRAAVAASEELMTLMTDRCVTAIEDHQALRVLD